MTHIFLSPHLDDAVFSCGGTIHKLTQQGAQVIILTITAGDPPKNLPDSPLLQDLHQRWQAGISPIATRRHEDSESAQVIGAIAQYETYFDCIYRQHAEKLLYPTEESIFDVIHPDDPLPKQLQTQTASFHKQFGKITCLYAPLGVGHHVDHQIVRDWSMAIYKHNPELCVKFYEDYPYTRDKVAIERARAYIEPHYTLTAETEMLSERNITAKIKAIACHQSQISTFWGNPDTMIAEIHNMFQDDKTYTYMERFWAINNQQKGQSHGK